jgi:hypothetical protein
MKRATKKFLNKYGVAIISGVILLVSFTLSAALEMTLTV